MSKSARSNSTDHGSAELPKRSTTDSTDTPTDSDNSLYVDYCSECEAIHPRAAACKPWGTEA
jgi:hypothetical protein